jgi:very-short-patch-repair endonuclease
MYRDLRPVDGRAPRRRICAIICGVSWGSIARRQAGLVTRAQLTEAGLSDSAVQRLLHSGALDRLAAGIYLARGAPLTFEAALWHAVLATQGVLGYATAAHLWGFLDTPPDRIHVVVAAPDHARPVAGVRIHRTGRPTARTVRRNGIPVSPRHTALLDHLGSLRYGAASQLADRAIQRGWLRREDIERRLREEPCRTGNVLLRRLGAQVGDGAAAQSERLLHRLLRRAGVRDFEPNADVWADGRFIGVVDALIRRARLAIEVDGRAFHTDVERFQRDRTRQNDLVGAGWTVLRFTWQDLVERPGYVVAQVRGHLARAA